MANDTKLNTEQGRILSIDFFRGFTMFLLVSGYWLLFDPASGCYLIRQATTSWQRLSGNNCAMPNG